MKYDSEDTFMRSPSTIVLTLCAPALLYAQQPHDAAYSARIKEYTTEPFFLTELVDHLPASASVPTPEKILGYIAGTPEKLTYSKDVHRYMRELEKASPRVKVITAGRSEEGRETLLVLISEEANLKRLDRLRHITAQLADPRKITPEQSKQLIEEGVGFYWASGSIHSPETGSPEMLMEMAYRLAVDETPFIQEIRRNAVIMITPVLEVDGRDKQVDLYNWRKANPGKTAPSLIYWGKYVAHDNNRDGMALSLALSRIVMKTFLEYHPQVLHDLHESVPFLYTSTGTGPYNAWLDPIVVNEWHRLAYHEVEEMTKRGVPGVWTHGFYDGWAANYMVTAAQGHNAIGRFYETYGGRGADTLERTVPESSATRTWYRPNPPLPKVKWSLRNNVNLQQSALLLAMNYFARNRQLFLENFYLKSRRSVEKAHKEGPAAWLFPADDPRPWMSADLLNLLGMHGIEVHRLNAAVEKPERLPAGSYVVRMDQPYSRMADMLLDRQFFNVSDPRPYDDTGWSLGPLRNIRTVRVNDTAFLKEPMQPVSLPIQAPGQIKGAATAVAYLIRHTAENHLASFRFRLKELRMQVAEEPFELDGEKFPRGAFLIPVQGNPGDLKQRLQKEAAALGVHAVAAAKMPEVARHDLAAPRIALVHSWINTQNEGWYRIAFDQLGIPYHYISDHVLRDTPNLRAKYDVILLGPTPGSAQRVVNGLPRHGDPIPWKNSPLTPNIGMSPDTSDDIRGGMGLEGLLHVKKFVEEGGLFITIAGNAAIPIEYGLVEGVSITQTRELQARGSVYHAVVADSGSPIAYGYDDKLAVYFNQAPVLRVSLTGGVQLPGGASPPGSRPSGRGGANDPDVPQGRPYAAPPPKPEVRPGEEPPISEEMREAMRAYLPPADKRPRVVLRFGEEKELLIAGMLAGGRELARQPAIVDVPVGKGHILLFANNPIWRNQTQGSFFLLFNAMMNFAHLDAGRKPGRATN